MAAPGDVHLNKVEGIELIVSKAGRRIPGTLRFFATHVYFAAAPDLSLKPDQQQPQHLPSRAVEVLVSSNVCFCCFSSLFSPFFIVVLLL